MKLNTRRAEESQLLAKVKNGSEKAFTILFDRFAPQLHKVCLGYTVNRHEAEECVQEVFTKIWIHRDRIIPELPFAPYLIRIAKNLLVDKARKKLFEAAYLKYQKHIHQHYTYSTENQIFLNELKTLLEKQISDMPEKREVIFRMSREQGRTNREIAQKMGISVRTVENHINAALKQLKKQLSQNQALVVLLSLVVFI